ncbi:MAG: TonB-dependent receptor [Gammaproteobacteria bacterium]|nr:TonB-dependent receptor [Gammaproteobacteria bacterium]
MTRTRRALLIALWTIGAGLFLPQVFAQQAGEAPAPEAAPIEEVVVTGSRIPVPANITSTSPTTIVSSQEVRLQGSTDITDLMNQLPQNIIGANSDFGNTSSPLTSTGGFSTVDLRGLGPQRTLVLVNGRRLGTGDPSTANQNVAPDIDQIPVPLIERVDVVTGGASATYGSDAIAGVVNFILKKDFEGIQIDGQYGFSQHSQHNSYVQGLLGTDDPNTGFTAVSQVPTGSIRDGYKHDLSILLGTNFDEGRGNFTGWFVYHQQQPVSAAARDFSDCQLISNGLVASPTFSGVECLGSSNSNRFTPEGVAPGAGTRYTVVGNQFLPWPQPGSNPPGIYDFNSFEYLQRQDKRFQAGFLAHEKLNDHVEPYAEFGWMDDKTYAVVAPSGLFVLGNPFTADNNELVNCSNPLLSAQQQSLLCTPAQIAGDLANPGSRGNSADVQIGRRNIEGGGRTSFYEHNNIRAVLGARGAINEAWSYDLYGSYYYVTTFQSNLDYLDYGKVNNALQVTTDPKTGQPVCISGGQCVPWNIFTTGGVTPAALNYLQSPGTAFGNNTEQVAHLDFTGELGKYGLQAPWANDGLAVNLGYEHRKDTVTFSPDAAETSGALAGFSGALVNINESYDINEAFVELRAPIAHNLPGLYDLTADVGYRYSDYNTTGTTNTYKFEVQYAPIRDARLRFSFDRAIRAPNLIELFVAPSYGQEAVVGTDPCAGVPTATLAQCEHTGVTPAQYAVNPATGLNSITQCVSGQCGQVIEGNTQLKPEIANTWSLGLTMTPTALPGFSASVDYYHIKLEQQIGNYPFTTILNGCLYDNNPIYCSQIVRTPDGALTGATVAGGGYMVQKDFNLGLSVVSGFDTQAHYRHELGGWGSIGIAFNGAYLWHDTTTPYPGSGTFDCAGLFGSTCNNGSVNPRWRHNLRVSWETPFDVLLSAQWRFIGPTSFDNNSGNPLLHFAEEGAYDAYNARIPGFSYLDLTASWHAMKALEVRVGVNNLLDKDPPLIPSLDISGNAGPANSFPTYDYLGRQVFVAFTAKF